MNSFHNTIRTRSLLALTALLCACGTVAASPAAVGAPLQSDTSATTTAPNGNVVAAAADFITPGSHSASALMHQVDGLLGLDCAINGHPVTLLLDSGTNGLALFHNIVTKFNIKVQGYGEVKGYGGSVDAYPIRIDSLDVKNCVRIRNATAVAIDMASSSEKMPGGPIAGLIGYDLLSRYVVQIDYKTNKITLIDPNAFKPDSTYGTPLPLNLDNGMPKIPAQLDNFPSALYVVDTGEQDALTLNGPYVTAHKLRSVYTHGAEEPHSGIGGLCFTWRTHVGKFTIAGITIKGAPAGFSQDAAAGGSVLSAGSLGEAFLSHFIVTFDYPHNMLYLKVNPRVEMKFGTDLTSTDEYSGLNHQRSAGKQAPNSGSPEAMRARVAIEAAIKQIFAAMEAKDVDAFMSHLAPEFTETAKDGSSMSRSDVKKTLPMLYAPGPHITATAVIESFTLKGKEAYVTENEHVQETFTAKDPGTQKPVSLIVDSVSKNVWCKIGETWKLKSTHVISETPLGQEASQ